MNFFRELEPSFPRGFVRADATSSRIAKNLRTASWATVKPGGNQAVYHLFIGHPAYASEVIQFNHRERLQVHVRKVAL